MVSSEQSQSSLSSEKNYPFPASLPVVMNLSSTAEEDNFNWRQFVSIISRRWLLLLIVSLGVSTTVILQVLRELPKYEGRIQLLVEPIAGDQRFSQFNQNLANQDNVNLDYDTQIVVLKSESTMTPIVQEIQKDYPELSYGAVVGGLQINRLDLTKILNIRYQDSDPVRLKEVLEKIARGYIQYSQKERQTGRRQGLGFVQNQLPNLQQRVNQIQNKVQLFRQQHNLIDPQSQGSQVSSYLESLAQQRQENQTQLNETTSLYRTLNEQIDLELDQAIAASALSQAPRYQQLLNQLQEIETQIALESARFTANSPNIQALEAKRQNLLPLIDQEASVVLTQNQVGADLQNLSSSPNPIRLQLTQELIAITNQLQTLQVREQALVAAEGEARQELQKLAQLTRQYNNMQRELNIATASLNRFLAVEENLEIEEAQEDLPWELILQPTIPQFPIAPNVPRGILIGVVSGILGGIGAVAVAEKLDNRYHSPESLKENTDLPLLGTIPFQRNFQQREKNEEIQPLPLASGRYQASPFLEAFRSLHANLSFISPDKPLQSLVVSSSVPMEGKSTSTFYLAQAAAAMGQQVLLVDADLRRPQIQVLTDLPNVWGLSHVISTDIEVEDVIQRSPVNDNLYILTAGQIPPDPTGLLSSQKMESLIQKLQQSFDLVIFDTPPLLGLADAKILAPQTDGIVLLVGLGKTEKTVLKQVLDGLKISRTPVLGMIANGAKGYTPGSYDYYQRYYTGSAEDSEP